MYPDVTATRDLPCCSRGNVCQHCHVAVVQASKHEDDVERAVYEDYGRMAARRQAGNSADGDISSSPKWQLNCSAGVKKKNTYQL